MSWLNLNLPLPPSVADKLSTSPTISFFSRTLLLFPLIPPLFYLFHPPSRRKPWASIMAILTLAKPNEPTGDFAGDIAVTNHPPSRSDLEKVADLPVLDPEGNPHTFKSLYASNPAIKQTLVIFIRHFFCGVGSLSPLFSPPSDTKTELSRVPSISLYICDPFHVVFSRHPNPNRHRRLRPTGPHPHVHQRNRMRLPRLRRPYKSSLPEIRYDSHSQPRRQAPRVHAVLAPQRHDPGRISIAEKRKKHDQGGRLLASRRGVFV